MKKNLILSLLALFSSAIGFAQTAYNPFTQNIRFSPEPTAQGFPCNSIQTVEFTQGLTTIADATDWQNNPLTVVICLTGFKFNGPASTAITGSYAANFNWEYDSFAPNCVIGTQKQTLSGTGNDPLLTNPAASGLIRASLIVPETSPISTVLAVNVNLQVPGYMSQFNSTPDDNESTQTQTFCSLKIKGNVYKDVTLINNTVDGTPISQPSGEQLYATLLAANGIVIATQSIASNGQYEFLNVSENTSYQVVLSKNPGVVGANSPVIELPATWSNVNEDCCDKIGTDGNANGAISVNVVRASLVEINFGIFSATALPIKLNYFFATESNCTSLLSWSTKQEINTASIDILRKEMNVGSFRKIATIQAAGNSDLEKKYSYSDETTESNTKYEYQLQFNDIDGQISTSEVRQLSITCNEASSSANIFPNPTTNNINLFYVTNSVDESLEVKIVDLTGRVIASKSQTLEIGANIVPVDLTSVAPGIYFIKYKELGTSEEGAIKFQKN